jgi:hypothetical protein
MRFLAVLFFIAAANAHADPEFLTTQVGKFGAFLMLRTPDCQRIYYAPRSYVLDFPVSQASYQRRTASKGAFDYVQPAVVLDLKLVPERVRPDADELAQALDWAAADTRCGALPNKENFEPYPSLLQHAFSELEGDGITVTPMASADNAMKMQIVIDPAVVTAAGLVRKLNFWRGLKTFDTFSVQTEAIATIRMSYAAIADFVINHYTEQVCYTQEECFSAFGVRLYCETHHWCDDIPVYYQAFKNLNLTSHITMESERAAEVPFYKLEELQEKLLADASVAAFQDKYAKDVADVVTITPGKMKKDIAGEFVKSASTRRAVRNTIQELVRVRGIGDAMAAAINSVYASPELNCLSKQKSPILTTNPCFKD